ncbi:MAG TPA: SLATT domain-containing protein [Thermoanaerobaculia bacterium]|jgi:hypothetical protein
MPHATDQNVLAAQWLNGVTILQRAQYRTAKLCATLHFSIGIPLVAISAAVSTAVFATLKTAPDLSARITVGLFSLAATVLAGLQTFLRLSERAERHKQAGVRYGGLRRELELEIVSAATTREYLIDFRQRWTALDEEAPTVPQWLYERSSNSVIAENGRP